MKKILVLTITMALILAGCCSLTAPDGTVTKSLANCFTAAQDKVCNAPADVITVADAVINLLKPVAATLVPGSAPFVAYVTAQNIKSTGCAALTSLNTMIAFIEGLNQAKALAQAKGISAAPLQTWINSSKAIDTSPLVHWAHGGK